MTKQEVKKRLEEIRREIVKERVSYGEIAELQNLAKYIDSGDVLLLEWAGVPEFSRCACGGSKLPESDFCKDCI